MSVSDGPHLEIIDRIKKDLTDLVGKEMKLRANKGRKVIIERIGTIKEIYPNLFVMLVKEDGQRYSRVSYSYVDLLTRTVELTNNSTNENILPWLTKYS
ncbi:MAG: Veg family protein [Actinobacteria bacterium]|nr:Veg family protein [Actinomycetota bacterium]